MLYVFQEQAIQKTNQPNNSFQVANEVEPTMVSKDLTEFLEQHNNGSFGQFLCYVYYYYYYF